MFIITAQKVWNKMGEMELTDRLNVKGKQWPQKKGCIISFLWNEYLYIKKNNIKDVPDRDSM